MPNKLKFLSIMLRSNSNLLLLNTMDRRILICRLIPISLKRISQTYSVSKCLRRIVMRPFGIVNLKALLKRLNNIFNMLSGSNHNWSKLMLELNENSIFFYTAFSSKAFLMSSTNPINSKGATCRCSFPFQSFENQATG